jgi:FkbM family methyltransferase
MILTTKTKIALAAMAYRTISVARAIAGKDDSVIVERGGLRWSLDLREGVDFSIYLLGAFERSTVATLEKIAKHSSIAFDIGANVGAHTLGLARSVGSRGRVYAFEPARAMFQKLQRNLALNPELQSRTSAHQVLFTERIGEALPAQTYASWPLVTMDHVHPKLRGRLLDTTGARVETVDNFAQQQGIERVHLIKIDVDGHEYPVLKGAAATLARFRPTLLMEISPYVQDEQKHGFPALVALLREFEYSLHEADTGKVLPLDADALQSIIPDGAGINAVAVPVESSGQ